MKTWIIIYALCLCPLGMVNGQFLNEHQLNFISENAISIEVDSNYQNGNWAPVIDKVKDKRLVLLGEFNHGSKEVFLSRNELIKSLHYQLGFDLILFESGLGEVGAIDLQKEKFDKSELLYGFFGGWRTSEFEDLMQFARKNNITVAGFDVQRTGSTFTSYLAERLENPDAFIEIEQRFVKIKSKLANYRTVYDSVKTETEILINDYRKIKSEIENQDDFLIRTLDNRITFLNYMLAFTQSKDWNRRWKERDQAMAENIQWLLNQYEPNRKAIIIAHNFHISRYNEKEEVMGEFLETNFDTSMYVLGVFAKDGSYHNNSGKPEQLSPADSTALDIKHVISADGVKMSFLDIPEQMIKGAEWLNEPIVVNDTFIDLSRSNHLILSKCFDGLLLIDKVSPPSN